MSLMDGRVWLGPVPGRGEREGGKGTLKSDGQWSSIGGERQKVGS